MDDNKVKNKVKFNVLGLEFKYFFPLAVIVLICTYGGFLPTKKIFSQGEVTYVATSFVATSAFLWAIGGFLFWLGDNVPVVGKYMGGSVLFPLFGAAALRYFNLIPEVLLNGTKVVMGSGLQDMYIAFLLVGSVLVMDRHILLSTTARYIPTVIGSQIFAIGFAVLAGIILGFGGKEALFNIAAPTMSGGSGGAIVTIPKLYSDLTGTDMMHLSGQFLGFVSISNVIAVILAAVLGPIMAKYKGMNGNGDILAIQGKKMHTTPDNPISTETSDYRKLAGGLFISLTFFLFGEILGKLPILNVIPSLAWVIIISIVVKTTGIIKDKVAQYTVYGMNFAIKGLLPMILAGIGINSMDLGIVIQVFTIKAFLIILLTVIGGFIGAAIFGKISGLYPFEAGLTAGLCCNNIGGSGDIAVLTAAKRMNLLAFASISTRIGGALMVIWIGILYRLLML